MGRLNWKFFLVLVGVLALSAGAAQAALVASNHDMPSRYNQTGAAAKSGACSFCHIPHGAATARLFPPSADCVVGTDWASDPNASMCYQCHGTATYAGARNVNPFQNNTFGMHGRNYNQLVAWGDVSSKAVFEGYAIPYVNATDNTISCASCHNAHDNDKRPFIRDINGSNYIEGNFATWCVACHVNRGLNANTGTHVNHPMNDNIVDSAAANIYTFSTMAATFFKSPVSNLNITMTSGGGAGVTGESWNLGGHVYTVLAGTGTMHCGTCHAVHSNETAGAGWGIDDGATVVATQVNNANAYSAVYPTDPTAGAEATICTGCHDITVAAAGPGIGGVSHPYVDVGPWATTITAVNTPAFGSPKFGGVFAVNGTGTTLVCQSCHDAHFARLPRAGTNAPDNNFALMRVACGECHNTSTRTGHHPANVSVLFNTTGANATTPAVYSANGTTVPIGSNFNWTTIDNAAKVTSNTLSRNNWSAGTGTYPFDNVNKMTCNTCHGGGLAKAHNNTAFPALTGTLTNDTMCVDCHGTNPSYGLTWFNDNASRVGTHLVGMRAVGANISTTYKWNYGAATAVTPLSLAVPRYGSGLSAGDNGALVCTSCHTLKITGITAQYSNNLADGEATTHDCVALLLTPSGNSHIDDNAATNAGRADFLCSACHGATPGGGFSHPTMPSYNTAATALVATKANTAANYVTLYDPGVTNRVNCESCHRPHNAAGTSAGARPTFILEDIGASLTYVQEEVLCNRCHSK